MKKIFKNILNFILSIIVNFLSKFNYGRYVLEKIQSDMSELKKEIIHNDQKLTFYVPSRMCFYRAETFSTKEPKTLSWIDSFEKNCSFWDIGANIGIYSCYATAKKNANVIAFEPSSFNSDLLAKNIFVNKLENRVSIFPLPMSNKSSIGKFRLSTLDKGGALSNFSEDKNQSSKKDVLSYQTMSITGPDLISLYNLSYPDYIKIDVDGIEVLILEGLGDVIKNSKSLLVEVDETIENQEKNISIIMKRLNFEIQEKFYHHKKISNVIWKKK